MADNHSSLQTRHLYADKPEDIATAVALLKQGELVALPTETVYGLAADASNPQAVAKIFQAKNRPETHPLIVHLADTSWLADWALPPSADAMKLAEAFWPGPLTLLLPKAPKAHRCVTGGLETIGLRIPSHPVMQAVLKQLGTALAAPSANPHQKLSPTQAAHVLKGLSGKIAAVLDGGACQVGLESTIVDCTGNAPRILRFGSITQKMLEAVLGKAVDAPSSHQIAVAGNMKVHYQPVHRAKMLSAQEILQQITPQDAVLYYSEMQLPPAMIHQLKLSENPVEYAAQLYTALHQLDTSCNGMILIESPPQDADWAAIHDRLSKATSE